MPLSFPLCLLLCHSLALGLRLLSPMQLFVGAFSITDFAIQYPNEMSSFHAVEHGAAVLGFAEFVIAIEHRLGHKLPKGNMALTSTSQM